MTTSFNALVSRIHTAIQDRKGHYPNTKHPSFEELIAAIDALHDAMYEARSSVTVDVPADMDAQLTAMLDRAIMIVGAAKSGTSLLRNLLDDHPQVIALPSQGDLMRMQGMARRGMDSAEIYPRTLKRTLQSLISHDLGGGPHWLLSGGEPAHEPYLQFMALTYRKFEQGPETFTGFFRAVTYALTYVHLLQHPGKQVPQYWLEQSPSGLRFADALVRDFPQAAVLYGVRDPRAVFASTKFRHLGKYQNFNVHHFIGYVLREWGLVRETMNGDLIARRRITHYEKLVSEPEETLKATLDFLGLPFDEATLTPTVLGVPVQANTAYKDARKAQIFTGSIDRWRERLSADEVILIERMFRKAVALADYELPDISYGQFASAVFRLKQQYQSEGLNFSIPLALRRGLRPPA